VRALSEQVKFLSINATPSTLHHLPQPQPSQSSPSGPSNAPPPGNINTSHLRQANIPPPNPPVPTYVQSHPSFQQPPPPQPPIHQQWYTSIAAPQASHPATIPQAPAPAPQQERTPPVKTDQWDENYLGVLHSQDPVKLRELLSRTNPDLVLPLNGPPLVSQAVILTLIHRVSSMQKYFVTRILLFTSIIHSCLRLLAKLLPPMRTSRPLCGGSSVLRVFCVLMFVFSFLPAARMPN